MPVSIVPFPIEPVPAVAVGSDVAVAPDWTVPVAASRGLARLIAEALTESGVADVAVADGQPGEGASITGILWLGDRLQGEITVRREAGSEPEVVRHEADLTEGHHLLYQLTESAARLLEVELPRRVISGFEDYRTPVFPALLQYLIARDAPEKERKGELIRAFELDASLPAVRIELALAAVQRGDTPSAISLVRGLPVGHPDWARELGTAAWAAGETDLAMGLLAAAVQANDDDGIAQAALAALLARKGEIDDSFYLATRATQLEADDYRSWAALADVHRAAGKFGEACFYYNFALRLAPDAPGVLKDAGASWVLARKPEQALKTIEKAIAVAPGDAENHGNLAFAHDLLGNAQPALEAARRAVELAAQNASLHVLRGDLALKLGLADEARQAWARAQELDPQLTIRPEGGNIGLPEPTTDEAPAPAIEFSGPFTIFK